MLEHSYQLLREFWPHFAAVAIFVVEVAAALHAVLYKRDSRSTIGWVGLIWLTPLIGAVLYFVFGINRIQRRAKLLRGGLNVCELPPSPHAVAPSQFVEQLGADAPHFEPFVRLVGELSERPLLSGNEIVPLINGDEAFPAMLEAIAQAQFSITLCSYIFDNDRAGRLFADALGAAVRRGVQVRVLVDSVGSRYSIPSIMPRLRKAKVPSARFMRTLVPTRFAYSNLRSHRKILVVDGRIGFTGGLNIREGAMLSLRPRAPLHDTHFRCLGPIVAHLQEVFVEDWAFTTQEVLVGEPWFVPLRSIGPTLARGIPNGPDEDYGEMRMTLMGALTAARRRVCILTPYFLPDDALAEALNVAALRGVQVDIVLPQANNLALVKWASTAMLWQVLSRGCRVWLSPPPFDHTKLMLVDGVWTLFGSANWDPRSLRLNFEFNVECYDRQLTSGLLGMVDQRIASARRITLADVDGRSLPIRLRDGLARLLSPYL